MKIGEKRLEQLKKMPLIQTRIFKSKDGRFMVNKTTITDIKPVEYFKTVLSEDTAENEDLEILKEAQLNS